MGHSKKIVPRMKDYEDDGMWMWVAFVPSCRLIISFINELIPKQSFFLNQ